MDPFARPCHPERRLDPENRDWRAIGVKGADDVRRKQTRCPDCKTVYTAFLRTFPSGCTVEWVRHAPRCCGRSWCGTASPGSCRSSW